MKRSIETLKENLMKIRTGRAHTGLLEHITVDYYGCPTPISQVAQLGLADARTITVQPWEKKMVAVVEKAIRNSDLGLNRLAKSFAFRCHPLTEERRRDLTKVVRSEGEETKVAIRNLRRDANNKVAALVKEKEISEDDERRSNTEIQKLTDKYIGEVDKLIAEKEKEIMTV
ncbi:ribosome recycling factor [Parasutterella sp.]|uniref:ribosome recycling factor n=1 Tax=Parasutterella sp. TaxID=2049037 RepID=UPI0039914264